MSMKNKKLAAIDQYVDKRNDEGDGGNYCLVNCCRLFSIDINRLLFLIETASEKQPVIKAVITPAERSFIIKSILILSIYTIPCIIE